MMDKKMVMSVIVAIFAALAAGIMIGSELVADRGSLMGYEQLIGSIEREFDRVKEHSAQLEQDLAETAAALEWERQVESELGERLVAGKLLGLRVGVVCWGSDLSFEVVEEVIRQGGGSVGRRITVSSSLMSGQQELAELVLAAATADRGYGGDDRLESVGEAVLQELDVIVLTLGTGDDEPPAELVAGLLDLGPRLVIAYPGPAGDHAPGDDGRLLPTAPHVSRALGAVILARLVSGDQ